MNWSKHRFGCVCVPYCSPVHRRFRPPGASGNNRAVALLAGQLPSPAFNSISNNKKSSVVRVEELKQRPLKNDCTICDAEKLNIFAFFMEVYKSIVSTIRHSYRFQPTHICMKRAWHSVYLGRCPSLAYHQYACFVFFYRPLLLLIIPYDGRL